MMDYKRSEIMHLMNADYYQALQLPTVIAIGAGAFRDCNNLREVELNDGLRKIGSYAFCNCKSLSSITLPSTVTEIDSKAFEFCNNLTKVMMHGVPREVGGCAFRNCTSLERFTFPTI